MKPQDIYSNMYNKSELMTPYSDSRQNRSMSNEEYAAPFKVSMTYGSGKKQQKPSRMPNLSFSNNKKEIKPKHSSVISTSEAINVVGLLKKELQKINCNLKNYFVRSHIRGIDIEKIIIFCSDTKELRRMVKRMDINKTIDHDRMKNTTSLALIAIAKKLKKKLKNELRLEAELYDFKDSDYGVISVTVPVVKKEPIVPPPAPMPVAPAPAPAAAPQEEGPAIGPEAGSPEEALLAGDEKLMPPLEIEGQTPEEGAIGEAPAGSPEAAAAIPGLPEERGAEGLPASIEPEEEVGRATQLPELI